MVEELAYELQFVMGALVRLTRAAHPAHDVTLSQVSILKRLDREGSHAVADLARLDKITHQSVTVAVLGLVERGLVEKTPDQRDRRRKLLAITDAGRLLLAERLGAGRNALATAIGDRLSPAEQAHLSEVLPLLRRLLD